MKRRAFKLLLFLLAGAIINVAVAWGCARRLPPQGFSGQSAPLEGVRLRVHMNQQVGSAYFAANPQRPEDELFEQVDWLTLRARMPRFTEFRDSRWIVDKLEAMPPAGEYAQMGEHWHGWPWLSLRCGYRLLFPPTSPNDIQFIDGFEVGARPKYLLPLRPIFPGFAINTIFYAAIVWVLFAVPGAVRRRMVVGGRHKRGQCAACGYSLRENVSEKCPECGVNNLKPSMQLNTPAGSLSQRSKQ